MVRLLLDHGADLNIYVVARSRYYKVPLRKQISLLTYAITKGHAAIAGILREYGAWEILDRPRDA